MRKTQTSKGKVFKRPSKIDSNKSHIRDNKEKLRSSSMINNYRHQTIWIENSQTQTIQIVQLF